MALSWSQDAIFAQVQRAIMAGGGVNGLRHATTVFRQMDTNGDHTLSMDELGAGLVQLGVPALKRSDLVYLHRAFDTNGDGRVSLDEFLEHLLLRSMPPRRRAVATGAFARLKSLLASGPKGIYTAALLARFAAEEHPAVREGRVTADVVRSDYFDGANGFDRDGDSQVSQEEFIAFLAGVSATVPSDDVFEVIVLRCFGVDDPTAPRLDVTQRDWSATATKKDPLATTILRRDEIVRGDGALAATSSVYGATTKRAYDRSHASPIVPPDTRAALPIPAKLERDFTSSTHHHFQAYSLTEMIASDPTASRRLEVTAGISPELTSKLLSTTGAPGGRRLTLEEKVISHVRTQLMKRVGVDGFVGIQRAFRGMDKDKNQVLSQEELQRGFDRIGVAMTPAEFAIFMRIVNRDGVEGISVTELCRLVRGDVAGNPVRMNIIVEVFKRLDTNGNGAIALDELIPKYNLDKHPSVINYTKTKAQVMQEFIADWDANRDGKVTLAEWVDYYSNISAGIDNDEYFELMMRNAWHVSGGLGAAANTTCRRVLAEFADGTQKVLEIKDDLGITAKDTDVMMASLRRDGHVGISSIKLSF